MSSKRFIMDYSKFMTKISKRRKPNLIRHLTEAYMKNPDALFFAGGMPNPKMFPFKEISVTYSDGTKKDLRGAELFSSLQYGPTQGHMPLTKKWRIFQQKWHAPKYDDWDVHVTTGSMEGVSKIFELIVEPGDPVMVQSPTYTGILSAILPSQPDFIPVDVDDDGALPETIEKIFEERLKNGKPLPKLFYANPTGANPVGVSYTNERKEKIYELAQRYNFLILEDDAYYFLHFLDEQPKSFLSLDVDGRVLRLDSFSKIMSAGLRIGIVTAPKPLLQKLTMHVQATTLHPSTMSQVLIDQLLESWSEDDVQAHFSKIQSFYRERRDIMLRILDKNFTDIAEWSVPRAGMFIWMKITVVDDVYDLVMNKLVPQGVFVLPGHAFYPDSTQPCPYVRLCYSQASQEDMEKGLPKIAEIIREEAKKSQKVNGA